MQKKLNKEQEILSAAEKLFAQKGFKNATTTLIAAQAGVTHAMLHYYFRTKDQIFLKVFDSYVEEVRTSLKSIMVPDVYDDEIVGKVTEICFDLFNTHRGQMTLFLEVAKDRPDLLETYVSDSGRYLGSSLAAHKERIERAVKEGRIREISFSDLIIDIISVCAASLFFDPVLSNMLRMNDKDRNEFLDRRKKEAVALIMGRLKK